MMIIFEQFNENLSAILGLLIVLIWLTYKLNWIQVLLKYYEKSIDDKFGIVLPSFIALLSPFAFKYLTKQSIPETFKLFLPFITFFLGQFTANYSKQKETKEKEEGVLLSLIQELLDNRNTIINNNALIQQELRVIDENKYVTLPLSQLKAESFTLLKVYFTKLLWQQKFVNEISSLTGLINEVNQLIQSRENLRSNLNVLIVLNGFEPYKPQLKTYDKLIQTKNELIYNYTVALLEKELLSSLYNKTSNQFENITS